MNLSFIQLHMICGPLLIAYKFFNSESNSIIDRYLRSCAISHMKRDNHVPDGLPSHYLNASPDIYEM